MPIIEVDGLRKIYGDRVVVDDVGFTVEQGEIRLRTPGAGSACKPFQNGG